MILGLFGIVHHALRAKRVCEPPTSSDATTFPEECGCRRDNPAEGSVIVFGTAVGAQKESITLKKVLPEGAVGGRLEDASKELLFTVPVESIFVAQVGRLGWDGIFGNGVNANKKGLASAGVRCRPNSRESYSCRQSAVCARCGSIWNE